MQSNNTPEPDDKPRQTPTPMGLRAYLVEDNPTIRDNLIGTLEELAPVRVVGEAEAEAPSVQWLNRHRDQWDLAIVDLFLKQGSGLGVLQACAPRSPKQTVVVLSNYATQDMRKRCLELGADAVFDKSNQLEALIAFCIEREAEINRANTTPTAQRRDLH